MGSQTDNIAEEFKNAELVIIAELAGLAPTSKWGSRKLVDVISKRLKEQGIPKLTGKSPEDMELFDDYLYVAGFTDGEGNVQADVGGGKEQKQTLEEFMAERKLTQKPDCFGFADDRDPACKRCALYNYCAEEHIASLPACYGELYLANDPECGACMEAPFCKLNSGKRKDAGNG